MLIAFSVPIGVTWLILFGIWGVGGAKSIMVLEISTQQQKKILRRKNIVGKFFLLFAAKLCL
jgi:hypothetical protein